MSPTAPPRDWRSEAARAVARQQRLERVIPPVLLDSPVSRAGFLYGCAVGWAWGLLWSTGRVERRGELWIFRGLPRWAFPRGGVCIGACFLTGDAPISDALLRHERVHVRQWRRFGLLLPVLYRLAGRDPLRNRFEIEAGLEDGNYVPRAGARQRDVDRPKRGGV